VTKSEAAFHLSIDRLAKRGRLYFWTFTFKEKLDLKDTRKRWNHLLTLMRREWPEACGLRVFELHEEHGLHVHLLTDNRIDVNRCRSLALRSGWGRIHVERIPKEKAGYLAKYLSKKRPNGLKGWRLWAAFGEKWEHSKVKNLEMQSLHSRVYRGLKEAFRWQGNRDFRERARIVAAVIRQTVLHGWTPGLGPERREYAQCSPADLLGNR